jgi:hypothetical protein
MTSEAEVRRYTVTNRGRMSDRERPPWVRRERAEPVPEIRLSGKWLGRAGFLPGSKVEVRVRPGCIVVFVTAPPDPEYRRKVRQ